LLFGLCKRLPWPSLQCAALLLLTLCLCFADQRVQWWSPPLPGWLPPALAGFTTGHGWHLWSWWLTVYFMVGHYSSYLVEAIRSHPLAKVLAVQRTVALMSAVSLCGFLAPFFFTMIPVLDSYPSMNDEHHWMVTRFYCEKTNQQKPTNIALDMACSIVLVGLLALAVQNVAKLLSRVGTCALASFLVHRLFGTVTTCGKPAAAWRWDSNRCYSFGIRIWGITLLPPLQTALEWTTSVTGLQILLFVIYVLITILVIGVPLQLCIKAGAALTQLAMGFLKRGLTKVVYSLQKDASLESLEERIPLLCC